MKKAFRWLFGLVLMFFMLLSASFYVYYWDKIPETIKIEVGSTQTFSLSVPASGTILQDERQVAKVFFSRPVTLTAGQEQNHYKVPLKLYGVLPFKKISIEVIDEIKVWPVGAVYGFYLETDGVLVIGIGEFESENGEKVNPSKNKLQVGDYIKWVNGERITSKKQFQKIVEESEGENLLVEGERNGKGFITTLTPVRFQDHAYKLGIWIRDNAQGVGTVTYVDENGCFGALGHPITDEDTSQILKIEQGRLYDAQILSVSKGRRNQVGEVHGLIDYQKQYICGELSDNETNGIYGYSTRLFEKMKDQESFSIALRQEIHEGEAYILSDVSGTPCAYSITITDVRNEAPLNQAISLTVTDSDLIELTGGIVQGMSGCPILQDGKLVGAVTHVLISDSKKGYGICMEDMILADSTLDK